MGHWSSDGEYAPGRVEAAQMEKNRWKKRAGCSENAMGVVRAILENPDSESDTEIVEAIIVALDEWEGHMERLSTCGDEMDAWRCNLPSGHKARHVGFDGHNHRHEWPNTAARTGQSVGQEIGS